MMEAIVCERNVRSPGTSRERAFGDVRVLVPLDRGLSASGSAHRMSLRLVSLFVICNIAPGFFQKNLKKGLLFSNNRGSIAEKENVKMIEALAS